MSRAENCDFCGKTKKDAKFLMADNAGNPKHFICPNCARLAKQRLLSDGSDKKVIYLFP